jgi:hypothetical protein
MEFFVVAIWNWQLLFHWRTAIFDCEQFQFKKTHQLVPLAWNAAFSRRYGLVLDVQGMSY